ncbi:spore germination protein [Paenibacillus shirakamiensis]|uniref:Spore germination protein n=1 Tax=Paenibacillus shirakamiensis TaxID=1265935 RepID=A0ABS4JG87_9BACL|nr:spore germination protein [Paenibacillus shirakamiensis]MBP2000722.1 spore germination protein [Paenibacillus shirakamiensis]
MRIRQSGDSLLQQLSQQLSGNADLAQKELGRGADGVHMLYLKSMSDSSIVSRYVITPFYEMKDILAYESYIENYPGTTVGKDEKTLLENVLKGFICLEFENGHIYLFEANKNESSPVSDGQTEVIVQGPSDAFTENLQVNINLIRHRYQSEHLKAELTVVGAKSRTRVAIMYDDVRVDKAILEELRVRLEGIKVDLIQGAGELDKHLSDTKHRLFPTVVVTERPDRAVFNLSEGKILLVVDTTGYVVILPSIFNDYLTAMDDKLQLPISGWFLKTIRYFGLIISTILPAIYVAFTSFNPEVWKVQIALLVAGSRASVPYPSYLEVFIMLVLMEFLTEASLRLPKSIGPTATTVGGLILGTAATEAGLVSNIMIIIVSAVAISNFVIPLNMMMYSIRVMKYFFIIFAAVFGLLGIVLGLVGVVMYLCSLRSFGKPYFKIFALDQWANRVQGGKENGQK